MQEHEGFAPQAPAAEEVATVGSGRVHTLTAVERSLLRIWMEANMAGYTELHGYDAMWHSASCIAVGACRPAPACTAASQRQGSESNEADSWPSIAFCPELMPLEPAPSSLPARPAACTTSTAHLTER